MQLHMNIYNIVYEYISRSLLFYPIFVKYMEIHVLKLESDDERLVVGGIENI